MNVLCLAHRPAPGTVQLACIAVIFSIREEIEEKVRRGGEGIVRRCGKEKRGEEHQKWDGISMMEYSLGSGEIGEGSGQESLLERRPCDPQKEQVMWGNKPAPSLKGAPDFTSQTITCQLEKGCLFNTSKLLCLAEG